MPWRPRPNSFREGKFREAPPRRKAIQAQVFRHVLTPALQEFEEDKTTDSKAEVRHEAPTLTPALQELQEGEATDSKAEVRHEAPLQEGEPHPTPPWKKKS